MTPGLIRGPTVCFGESMDLPALNGWGVRLERRERREKWVAFIPRPGVRLETWKNIFRM